MRNLIVFLALFFSAMIVTAQNTVEISIGIGGTAVNLDKLVELDEVQGTSVTDWDVLNAGIGAQYYFLTKESYQIGAELMYQHMYWYAVRVPYGTQTIYRDYSVSAVKLSPLMRFMPVDNFAIDFGPSINIGGSVYLGSVFSVNYFVPITEVVSIPLKLRLDPTYNVVFTVPVSFQGGVRLSL